MTYNWQHCIRHNLPSNQILLDIVICLSSVSMFVAIIAMWDLWEQRCDVKFCVKLRKTLTETFHLLKYAYGSVILFKIDHQSIDDSRRPLTSTDDTHVQNINEELAKQIGNSVRSCRDILTDKLKTHWVEENFVSC